MNEDYDISQVQVPDSFIKQILEETSPLEEEEKEDHTHQEGAPMHQPQSNEVIELLSLMFEEFDKLNARLDSLQENINEISTAGGVGTGYSVKKKKKRKGGSSTSLSELLANHR